MDLGSLSGEETVLSRALDADERDSVTSVPIAADIILISMFLFYGTLKGREPWIERFSVANSARSALWTWIS